MVKRGNAANANQSDSDRLILHVDSLPADEADATLIFGCRNVNHPSTLPVHLETKSGLHVVEAFDPEGGVHRVGANGIGACFRREENVVGSSTSSSKSRSRQ